MENYSFTAAKDKPSWFHMTYDPIYHRIVFACWCGNIISFSIAGDSIELCKKCAKLGWIFEDGVIKARIV